MTIVALLFCLIAAGITGFILLRARKPETANSYTKGEINSTGHSSPLSTGSTSNSQPGDQKSSQGGTNTNNSELLAPSGDFVSNHRPNLSGSPAPNLITSTCTTTPGASCTITFTKDGIRKSLPSQVTDRGGSTYWTWKIQDIGLTTGTWKIQAIASLNDETKTATDAMDLTVSQ